MDHPLKRCCRSKKKTLLLLFCVAGLTVSLFTFFTFQTNSVEVSSVNWQTVLDQTSLFFISIVCLIRGYFRDYYTRYSAWRIILYVLIISLTSYVLVAHVLDSLALLSWDQLKGNVIRRLDDSVIITDENRNETTSMIRTEKPKVLEEHFRYNNEDVRFRCNDVMVFESEVEPDSIQVVWKHNGEDIIPSWKYNINSTSSVWPLAPSRFIYVFESTLTIYLIENRDFGNYSCHIRETTEQKLKNYDVEKRKRQEMSDSEENYYIVLELLKIILQWNPYVLVGEYKLSKIPSTIITESAPPGGIVSLSASYLNEAEKEDIVVGYFINNKPYYEVCSGLLSGCSLFTFMYWRCWHPEGNSDGIPNFVGHWERNKNSILANAWQCACPSTYGIHSFKFYRNFYNVSSGRHVVVEVDHPTRIRLIPRTADLFLIFQNDSKPQQFGEECFDSIPFTSSCSWLQSVINDLNRNYFIIEYSVFSICLCLTMFISYIARKWIIHCITPVRDLILEGRDSESLTESKSQEALGGIGNTDASRRFDVYISHADSENELAQKLADILESFGKKVYYRYRDVAAGQVETEEVAKAITTSSKYLVNVSVNYISSYRQPGYEFHMILREIDGKRIKEKDVLLLKHGTCNISNFFYSYSDMQILDYDTNSVEELTRKLKRWSSADKGKKSKFLSFDFLFLISGIFVSVVIIPSVYITVLNYIIRVPVMLLTKVIYG